MLPFHRRLAEIGLSAISEFGFVLAGGYAISANGMGDRPSEDVDMFTNRADPDDFASAVERLRSAYLTYGLHVEDIRIRPTFADFHLTDPATGEASSVQLGLDFRAFPPATLDVGPVLDPRDAVAAKMSALWSRDDSAVMACSPSQTSPRPYRWIDKHSLPGSARPADTTRGSLPSTASMPPGVPRFSRTSLSGVTRSTRHRAEEAAPAQHQCRRHSGRPLSRHSPPIRAGISCRATANTLSTDSASIADWSVSHPRALHCGLDCAGRPS